jgi:hypothetical protein
VFSDSRFPYICAFAFDVSTHREVIVRFCDDDGTRCLAVPENLKLETAIPTKMGKGKVLLFIKLRSCVLKKENMQSDVSALAV